MAREVANEPEHLPVVQFSVFADNKVGRLNELVQAFAAENIHIVAISSQDTTESTIMRFVVNYPRHARHVLKEYGYSFTEIEVLAVELNAAHFINEITAALVEAEINIHYLYAFIVRPNDRSALVISLEDPDLATQVLNTHGIRILHQGDIGR